MKMTITVLITAILIKIIIITIIIIIILIIIKIKEVLEAPYKVSVLLQEENLKLHK